MNFRHIENIHLYNAILLIKLIIIPLSNCSFKDRIHVHSNLIHIKYEHQLQDGTSDFQQTVDTSPFHETESKDCSENKENVFCLQWGDVAKFKITKFNDNCEDFEYKSKNNVTLRITFNIDKIHLYGGKQKGNQTYPIEFDEHIEESFTTTKHDFTLILESYWLTSSGFYLHVNDEVPLFTTLNKKENLLHIISKRENPFIRQGSDTVLTYRVCKFGNMKLAHQHAAVNVFEKPKGIPDIRMIKLPIWTTWAKFKSNISQDIVLDFAKKIVQYGFPNSQLEIDDKWQMCFGSLIPDQKTFPDMKNMVKQLKDMGYRVTLWVHPFINADCEPYFSEAKKLKYFVTDTKNSVETKWWHDIAGHIDFTNPEAVNWWQERLNKLRQEYGIDGFKFDAGESGWLPQLPVSHEMRNDHPETVLKAYVKAASHFGNMIEVRSAKGTQQYPIFVRMMDLETQWRGIHSLSTMIPVLLHMNIIGYSFVLPDMIGGNGYNGDILSKELFIRWLQLTTFMPALQFSYSPWEFGEDVVNITKKFVNLHIKYTMNIVQAMKQTTEMGTPVNPPIWWIDPTDSIAQTIDTEFLLGENILVAPVMEESAKSRDIYLPRGVWKDEIKGDTIKGPIWLKNYPADLDVLPYFSKINNGVESISPTLALITFSILIYFFNR